MGLAAVWVAFFLSGVSALLFETLWLRLCGIGFGNAITSAAVTLSSFMAGLALGAAIATRVSRTKTRPLVIYACLEVIVGFTGFALIWTLPNVALLIRPLLVELSPAEFAANALRFVVCFVLLLIPAAAMGLTLPVLVADQLFQERDFRRTVALSYGWNTLGAVIGALLGEAFLLRFAGVLGTAAFAAGFNIIAASIAFIIARGRPNAAPQAVALNPVWPRRPSRVVQGFLAISFGAGASLLALEVVWFRFLRLYVASSSIAFAIMLAVVLSGIGLGSLAVSFARRRAIAEIRALPSILLFVGGMVTLLTYVFFPMSILERTAASWHDFAFDTWREIGVLAVALMFPTAFVSGMLFPATVAAIDSVTTRRMNSAGIAAFFNTAGAALGPLIATFLLLPTVGFEKTLIACAILYALLGAIAYFCERGEKKRSRAVANGALAIAFVVSLVCFPYGRAEQHFAHARRPFQVDGARLVAKREGNAETWQLLQRDLLGQPYYYRLIANAFSMASTQHPNERYMRLFAYLPLTFRVEAKDALLLCFGCGITADALTQDRQLRHIDIVDLSKEVFELANFFPGTNPLHDPRVTKYVQDARFFLQATQRKYDVITGEPPPPKVAGSVNIYTEEFFRLMSDALNEGGIATFWLPIYQLRVEETEAILRAFHNAFPNASVWASSDDEWIMMGIKGSTPSLDRQQMERFWQVPNIREDLKRIGLEAPAQLAALFVMDAPEIERISEQTPPLCDMYPKRLTDASANRVAVHAFSLPYLNFETAERRFRSSALPSRLFPEEIRANVDQFLMIRSMRYRSYVGGSNKLAELDFYLRKTKLRGPVLEVVGSDEDRVAITTRVVATTATAPNNALPDLCADALAGRNLPKAISILEEERARGIATRNDVLLLIYLNCFAGHSESAENIASSQAQVIGRDWFVDWLYGKLQAEYGFRPPR